MTHPNFWELKRFASFTPSGNPAPVHSTRRSDEMNVKCPMCLAVHRYEDESSDEPDFVFKCRSCGAILFREDYVEEHL